MKIVIEKNPSKIRKLRELERAEEIFGSKTKKGFFALKDESEFKKFREYSKLEDIKFVELHIEKDNGEGEYKLNGNLSYNERTKEIKFYVLSVFEFDNFRINDKTYIEVNNVAAENDEAEFEELKTIIDRLKETVPFVPKRIKKNFR